MITVIGLCLKFKNQFIFNSVNYTIPSILNVMYFQCTSDICKGAYILKSAHSGEPRKQSEQYLTSQNKRADQHIPTVYSG